MAEIEKAVWRDDGETFPRKVSINEVADEV